MADHNREVRDRIHRLLDAWLDDAFAKHEFFGAVNLEVQFNANRIIGINPTLRQTIKT